MNYDHTNQENSPEEETVLLFAKKESGHTKHDRWAEIDSNKYETK
jgi:hypothetical protein